MSKIVNSIAALIALTIGGGLLFFGLYMLWIAGSVAVPMVVGSYMHYRETYLKHVDPYDDPAFREKWHKLGCNEYFNANIIMRHTWYRNNQWCEAYRGKP